MNLSIEEIEGILFALRDDVAFYEKKLQKKIASEYIETHNLTLDKVELSDGDGVFWFEEIQMFTSWIAFKKNPKPFFEWNGTIFKYEEHRSLRTPVTIDNLTEKES